MMRSTGESGRSVDERTNVWCDVGPNAGPIRLLDKGAKNEPVLVLVAFVSDVYACVRGLEGGGICDVLMPIWCIYVNV